MILRPGQQPCHKGAIEVVVHDTASKHIITGGADGYIRLWDYGRLNEAEADDDAHHVGIDPVDELLLAEGARVKALLQARDHWMVLDESGALLRSVHAALSHSLWGRERAVCCSAPAGSVVRSRAALVCPPRG
jgi:WD40 repeat protein